MFFRPYRFRVYKIFINLVLAIPYLCFVESLTFSLKDQICLYTTDDIWKFEYFFNRTFPTKTYSLL